tara:strand:- start:102 stop:395 length:294 start_codon:yes stop_codon:yes gene_type:complete
MGKHLTPRKSDGKYMIQVLLPHAQGDFYVRHIEEKLKRKVNAFTKDLIINFIKEVCSEDEYEDLKLQDDKDWNEAVKQRVETRYKAKKENQPNPEET